MHAEVEGKCKLAKKAAPLLAALTAAAKNEVLEAIAGALENSVQPIIEANRIDLENLQKKDPYTTAFHDRLLLNRERIEAMAAGLREIALVDDPVGVVSGMWKRPNGLQIGLVSVPIGVVGIIYEARPNVTVDAAGLALKAGNAVVLRGSSEAINSNRELVRLINEAVSKTNLPAGTVSLITDTSREAAADLMKADRYLDLLIPRGGPGLIRSVLDNSTVPVIQTGAGNCHIFVDREADLEMAKGIAVNAKVQRPGVCNAMETLLVHEGIADRFLPVTLEALKEQGVQVRGCEKTARYSPDVLPAEESDWETEYLDLILAVKVVVSIDEAIDHINRYNTGHSEAIITNDYFNSRLFLERVDAAAVYVNASTRFTDGSEFGLGAEMGISTQKLHARGPMGLEALTSKKYIIYGSGQVRN